MSKPISLHVHKNNKIQRARKNVRSLLRTSIKTAPPDTDGFMLVSWTCRDSGEIETLICGYKDYRSTRAGLEHLLRRAPEEFCDLIRDAAEEERY